MPSETPPERRDSKEAQRSRGPSGISVRDVQILMQLRGRLQKKMTLSSNEAVSLQKLDKIADDLIRDGMNVFDEWDRTALPNRAEELEDLEEDINWALSAFKEQAVDGASPVRQSVSSAQIIESQGAFLIGCQNGLYLSATVGTTFTAALLSGSEDAAEVASRCNSDPLTTSPRFWHWLNNATPVFIHDSAGQPQVREQALRQVMAQSGCDKELVIFDGNDEGDEGVEAIVEDFRMVDAIRKEMGGESRGMLFYDKKKQLHKFKSGDPKYDNEGKGAALPAAEERFIRANKGEGVDVRLDRTSAVGIDPPQGRDSIGVHFGLYEDDECRLDLFKQQFGRFSRESDNLQHQPFYVVVDVSKLEDVDLDDPIRDAFTEAHKAAQEAERHLVASFGVKSLSECTEEQQKAFYGQLQVSPPDPREKDKDQAMEAAVSKEIERLSQTEWKGFSAHQQNVLKAFKLAQWHEKKSYLIMTAHLLAHRDVTEHTSACEESLQKGARFSEADRILAEEHKWLIGDALEVVAGVSLNASPTLKNKVTRDLVSDALKKECIEQLKHAPRRKLSRRKQQGTGSVDEVNLRDVANPEYLKVQVDRVLSKVQKGGVHIEEFEYSQEIQKIVREAAMPMCKQAEEVYQKVLDTLAGSGAHDREGITSAYGILENHIRNLNSSDKCVDEGLETEKVMKKFYQALVVGLQDLQFPTDKGTHTYTQNVCRALLGLFEEVSADPLPAVSKRRAQASITTHDRFGNDTIRFRWPFSPAGKRKRGTISVTSELQDAQKLGKARDKAAGHRQEAKQRRNAVEFCKA
ncbi:MAG: hypothetical protein ACPG5T_03330, partial [Endozoicomonas sp.]